MKLLVVGTPEDVTGFALAGVEGVACTNREEAGQAIADADADTLVLVSAEHARGLARNALVVVLPVVLPVAVPARM
jgi:vacuolar-type H+-ATPase subunit F/Vma7